MTVETLETPAQIIARILVSQPVKPMVFKPWPYEQLLNEAGAIVDRCLDIKRQLDGLFVEQANLGIQLLADRQSTLAEPLETEADSDTFRRIDAQRELNGINQFTFESGVSNLGYEGSSLRQVMRDLITLIRPLMDDGQPKNMNESTRNARVVATQTGIAAIGLAERVSSATARTEFGLKVEARNAQLRTNAAELRRTRSTLVSKGGPLDYESRISKLIDDIMVPYLMELRERCTAIKLGMRSILGQECDDLPTPDLQCVENFHRWLRTQAISVSKFTHYDQGFSITLSTAQLGINVELGVPFHVPFPKDTLQRYSHCRLRGVSSAVETSNESDLFRAEISPPTRGAYYDAAGQLLPPLPDDFEVPWLTLGRVGSRRLLRQPEVSGSTSLLNVSTLGIADQDGWQVKLSAITANVARIDDFQLELFLLGRPQTASANRGAIS